MNALLMIYQFNYIDYEHDIRFSFYSLYDFWFVGLCKDTGKVSSVYINWCDMPANVLWNPNLG